MKYFNIPPLIRQKIKDQFNDAAKRMADKLERNIDRGSNPQEETITGGFFHDASNNIKGSEPGITWRIEHHDFTKTQENKLGADVAISVEVIEEGFSPQIRTKSILIQCKKETNTDYVHASEQAKDMIGTGIDSRFAVFGKTGINVYDAHDVTKKNGNWKKIEAKESMGDFIGDQVLGCHAGSKDKNLDNLFNYFHFIHPKQFPRQGLLFPDYMTAKNWLRLLIYFDSKKRLDE